jgi:hypothetical protein
MEKKAVKEKRTSQFKETLRSWSLLDSRVMELSESILMTIQKLDICRMIHCTEMLMIIEYTENFTFLIDLAINRMAISFSFAEIY